MEEEEEEQDGRVESGSNAVSLWPQDNPSPYSGSNRDISVAGMCHFGSRRSDSQQALEPKSKVSRESDALDV